MFSGPGWMNWRGNECHCRQYQSEGFSNHSIERFQSRMSGEVLEDILRVNTAAHSTTAQSQLHIFIMPTVLRHGNWTLCINYFCRELFETQRVFSLPLSRVTKVDSWSREASRQTDTGVWAGISQITNCLYETSKQRLQREQKTLLPFLLKREKCLCGELNWHRLPTPNSPVTLRESL